jgi:hypothetical protein
MTLTGKNGGTAYEIRRFFPFSFLYGNMRRPMNSSPRIQILAATKDAGLAGHAIASMREHLPLVTDAAHKLGAEALLVCPAPEEDVSEGFEVVIAARFGQDLDEDAVFWRQRDLANEIYDRLRVAAIVVDFDSPLKDFLHYIEHLLAVPYRDEIGGRSAAPSGL